MDFFHKVIDNTCTTGCWVGAMYVVILWLLVSLIKAFIAMKRRNGYITMTGDDNGSFMLSYKAVKTHLKMMLSHEFPQMVQNTLIIRKHAGGYAVKLLTKVSGNADIKRLSNSAHDAVKNTLDNVLGLTGVFNRIDIVVMSLRPADGYRSAAQAEQPASEEQTAAPLPPLEPTAAEEQTAAPLPPLEPTAADKNAADKNNSDKAEPFQF